MSADDATESRVPRPGVAFMLSRHGALSSRRRSASVTRPGRRKLAELMTISAEPGADVTKGLQPDEVERLVGVLDEVAHAPSSWPGARPGFADGDDDRTEAAPTRPTAKERKA